MMYVRCARSLRSLEDLLAERGIDISYETVRFWWNRFGPIFAAEIRRRRVAHMRSFPQWRWHLDEVFVRGQPQGLPRLSQRSGSDGTKR
jgi:putative transposase